MTVRATASPDRRDKVDDCRRAAEVEPIDLTDALAVAFTAALLDAIGDPETVLQRGRRLRRSSTRGVRSAGNRTRHGAGAPPPHASGCALGDSARDQRRVGQSRMGPVLQRRLTESLQPEVLRRTGIPVERQGRSRGSGEGWVPAKPAAHRKEPDMDEIAQIESRIRADVVTLDRIIRQQPGVGVQLRPPLTGLRSVALSARARHETPDPATAWPRGCGAQA